MYKYFYMDEEEDDDDDKETKGSGDTDFSGKLQQKLFETRSIIISGEINQRLTEKVITQLLLLQELGDEPIKLFINSQGGHVEAADSIHDMIQFIKPKVITIGTGWVASAGIPIFLAAAKEDRYSLPNTRYMIHQPMGGVRGQASDIKIEAEEIIRMRARVNRLISQATGQTFEKIEQDSLRNFWLTAEEAVVYGIVGKVVKSQSELA